MSRPVCCPCCRSSCVTPVFQAQVLDRYIAQYLACDSCGSLYVPSPTWLDEAYADQQAADKFDSGAGWRAKTVAGALRILSSHVPLGPWLDFGSGRGLLAKELAPRTVTQYDALRGETAPVEGAFSLISCIEVIEHTQDPIALLVQLKKLLLSGGLIVLSTQLRRLEHNLGWPYLSPQTGQHITFPSAEGLSKACEAAGLRYLGSAVHAAESTLQLHMLTFYDDVRRLVPQLAGFVWHDQKIVQRRIFEVYGPAHGGPAIPSEWLFIDRAKEDILYRALFSGCDYVLPIAESSFFPPHSVLDETMDIRGHTCRLVEIRRFPFQIRIQELPKSRVLRCILFLIELTRHSLKFGAVPADIHEANFLWYGGAPYWVDFDAFRPSTDRWTSQAFVLIGYLLQRYFLDAQIPSHEGFDMGKLIELGGWMSQQRNRNFTDVAVWTEFHNYVTSLRPPEPARTHWSDEYGIGALSPEQRAANPKFAALLNLVVPGRTLLDVGCNRGYTCTMLRNRFDYVLGFDTDERCIELAMDEAPDADTNFARFSMEHMMATGTHPIFTRFQADVVLVLAITHHLASLGYSASKVGRTLADLTRRHLVIEDIVEVDAYDAAFQAGGLVLEKRVTSYPSGRWLSLWRRV